MIQDFIKQKNQSLSTKFRFHARYLYNIISFLKEVYSIKISDKTMFSRLESFVTIKKNLSEFISYLYIIWKSYTYRAPWYQIIVGKRESIVRRIYGNQNVPWNTESSLAYKFAKANAYAWKWKCFLEKRVLYDGLRTRSRMLHTDSESRFVTFFCSSFFSVTKCHMIVRVNRANLCAIGWSYATEFDYLG